MSNKPIPVQFGALLDNLTDAHVELACSRFGPPTPPGEQERHVKDVVARRAEMRAFLREHAPNLLKAPENDVKGPL